MVSVEFCDDSCPLDADLDVTGPVACGIFADNYGRLRSLGWKGVLWLPEGAKAPPLGPNNDPLRRSLTGYGGIDADCSELHLIATQLNPNGNIGVRAPRDVSVDGAAYDLVFLDVDAYEKGGQRKVGDQTIAEITTVPISR